MNALNTKPVLDLLRGRLEKLDLPQFLRADAVGFLESLHRFKLENVSKNFGIFQEFLALLDREFAAGLEKLFVEHQEFLERISDGNLSGGDFEKNVVDENFAWGSGISRAELDRFFSQKNQKKFGEKFGENFAEKISKLAVMAEQTRVRGQFLFSVAEFCHGSATRMEIFSLEKKLDPQNLAVEW